MAARLKNNKKTTVMAAGLKVKTHKLTLNELKMIGLHANKFSLATGWKDQLRWLPSKRTRHRFPMKLRMLLLQDKEILKT